MNYGMKGSFRACSAPQQDKHYLPADVRVFCWRQAANYRRSRSYLVVSQRELAGWTQNATHFCPTQCLKPRWQNYGRGTRAVESPAQAEDLVEVDKAYVLQPHIRLPLLYTDGMYQP